MFSYHQKSSNYHQNSKSYAKDYYGTNLIPVDVIASFAKAGGVKPLYLRYENEEKELITVPILSIENESCIADFVDYICNVEVGEVQKQIKLSYHAAQLRWIIKKSWFPIWKTLFLYI